MKLAAYLISKLSRGLPKTNQTTEYQAGDDGTYEAGWWEGRSNANNRTRYISKTIEGDDVVIDNATGLMWAADGNEAGCSNGNTLLWASALGYANDLVFAGYSDWRLPNVRELMSIYRYETTAPPFLIVFPNTAMLYYWASTTYKHITSSVWVVNFLNGESRYRAKTFYHRLRCVRNGLI